MTAPAPAVAVPHRPRSIAAPIMALVIAAVVVATIVAFDGPPPNPARGLNRVAAALRGDTGRGDGGHAGGPAIVVTTMSQPPSPGPEQHVDPETAERLAALLNVPVAALQVYTERPEGEPPGLVGDRFTVALRTPRGWRVVVPPPQPFLSHWHLMTLAAIIAAIVVLALPAWA